MVGAIHGPKHLVKYFSGVKDSSVLAEDIERLLARPEWDMPEK